MMDILAFDSGEDSFLRMEEQLKPDKSQLPKCLEAFIEIDDFCFNKRKQTKTSVIVAFVSLVRKIPMKRLNTINDALAYMWKKITDTADRDEMSIVYDSYLEISLNPLSTNPTKWSHTLIV